MLNPIERRIVEAIRRSGKLTLTFYDEQGYPTDLNFNIPREGENGRKIRQDFSNAVQHYLNNGGAHGYNRTRLFQS